MSHASDHWILDLGLKIQCNECMGVYYGTSCIISGPAGSHPPSSFFIMTSAEDIQMNHHEVNMTSNNTVIFTVINPASSGDVIEVFIKYTEYPNATFFDYKTRLPHDDSDAPEDVEDLERWRYTFHPPSNMTALNGTYVMGIRLVRE